MLIKASSTASTSSGGDDGCCDRLVGSFTQYANWDDDPADFSLAPEYLTWMNDWKTSNWDNKRYSYLRIEKGPFESEEDFLRWNIRWPDIYKGTDKETRWTLVNIEKVQSTLQRIKELGGDIGEFDDFLEEILEKQFSMLKKYEEEVRKKVKNGGRDLSREGREKAIKKTKAALADLTAKK